jgi:hypothetical protein
MKKINLFAVLALATAPAFLHAQTTSYSDIVGYTTTVVKGTGSSGSSQYFSFVPIQLQKDKVFQGPASASTTTVTLTGASLTSGALNAGTYPTHYLLLTSGVNAGLASDITSNSTSTVTTVDDLSASINAGASVAVVPHIKVTDVLGVSGSQKIAGGSTASSADNIYLVGSDGNLKTFYYKTGVGAGLKTSANTDATGLVVYPGESILVGRKVTSDTADIVQTGLVPTSDVKSVFTQGYSTSASGAPVPLKLSDLTSVAAGASTASAADNLFVIDSANGQLKAFYYKTGVGAGWKTSANANADVNTELSDGFVFLRRSATPTTLGQAKTW